MGMALARHCTSMPGTGAIAAWSLKVVVWHERKQTVWICVAIFELDYVPVG